MDNTMVKTAEISATTNNHRQPSIPTTGTAKTLNYSSTSSQFKCRVVKIFTDTSYHSHINLLPLD